MNKLNFQTKNTGDTLEAQEWNQVVSKVDELVDASNNGGGGSVTPIDTQGILSVSSKGNVTLGSTKNINLEPIWDNNAASYSGNYGDIALKPGDDVQFCSHHREPKKRDKIVVKNIDGSDNPVKLQVVAGELDLAVGTENNPKTATRKKNRTTGEDISGEALFKTDDAKVLDVRILTGNILDKDTNDEREERGYLKVRAQAIDLRCEKHGGIALQPKGYDSNGNMDKIKFEHGGGDGLEFGTFNTEKSSLYTDEYRFKRDGIWKMATRQITPNNKTVYDDNTPVGKTSTAANKYVKQADDFYDVIDVNDEQCTTKDIIKTAYAMNGGKDRHTKITKKGAIEIATNVTWTIHITTDNGSAVNVNTISDEIAALDSVTEGMVLNEGDFEVSGDAYTPSTTDVYTNGTQYFEFVEVPAPAIKIESGGELKLGGVLDFGSSFNFGETDGGIEVQHKYTKKGNLKNCDNIKVIAVNNSSSEYSFNTLKNEQNVYDGSFRVKEQKQNVSAGESLQIAGASIYNIIKAASIVNGSITNKYQIVSTTNGSSNILQVNCTNINKPSNFLTSKDAEDYYTSEEIINEVNNSVLNDQNTPFSVLDVQKFSKVFPYAVTGSYVIIQFANNEEIILKTISGVCGGTYFNTDELKTADSSAKIYVDDAIKLLIELKNMKDNNQGPWAV